MAGGASPPMSTPRASASNLITFPTSADPSVSPYDGYATRSGVSGGGGTGLDEQLLPAGDSSDPPSPSGGGGGGGVAASNGATPATQPRRRAGRRELLGREPWARRAAAAWRRWVRGRAAQEQARSEYLTLIPLSDSRLQPRRTRLLVAAALALAALLAAGVFVAVPRGVSVGTLRMHSTRMRFNASTMNYRIVLGVKIPVNNPNYFAAALSGNLSVSFYDADAGSAAFGPTAVAPRAAGAPLQVKVDASNLPGSYTAVVIGCCLNFPRKLIFFLTARFRVRYFAWAYDLPLVDSYFMLDCGDAAAAPAPSNALIPGGGLGDGVGGDDGDWETVEGEEAVAAPGVRLRRLSGREEAARALGELSLSQIRADGGGKERLRPDWGR